MNKGEREKRIDALKRTCQEDLQFLCQEVLAMSDWDSRLHGGLEKFLGKPSAKKLILMPRGHLKSSIITCGWVIQQILKDLDTRILITNAVWDRSREFLNQISGYLTNKSVLPDVFGAFDGKGARFTVDEITIAQKSDPKRRGPTIRTGGVESALTGSHCDIIVHDDLVEEHNIGTPEQVKKVIRFYQNSLDLLDPGGKMVVVGTRWAIGDLYGHIMASEMDSINGHVLSQHERGDWRKYAVREKATSDLMSI